MSTLLQNDVAPLWVWILVIAIGSVLVILILGYLIQRCIRTRRQLSKLDVEANGPPTRRLSVKNGKVIASDETTEKSRLLRDSSRPRTSRSDGQEIDHWRGKEKSLADSPSTVASSNASPSATRYSKAPKLSLAPFDDRGSFDGFRSVSDVNIISKPVTAVISEPRKKAINFSRPQIRAPTLFVTAGRSRLSVINEATPRNSIIDRIVSWASNSNDSGSKTPQLQPTIVEKAADVDVDVDVDDDDDDDDDDNFMRPREDLAPRSSPLINALQELQRIADAPTPELPCKHPSRTPSTSDEVTLMGSRTSSITSTPRKHAHKRSDSGTNFSRKGPYTSQSRSSSVTNFSRPQAVADHSRTSSTTSTLEEPQATLNGPFDALDAMMSRESISSSWSDLSYHANLRAESRAARHKAPSPDIETSTIDTDFLMSGRTSAAPSASSFTDGRWRHRSPSRSRSRSRGPAKAVNRSGQTVLRKKPPEITMIGPVDPAALENLSIASQ